MPRNPLTSAEPPPQAFPIRERYTVSGLVVGDVCFTCRCRIVDFAGDEGMVLAWCEYEWPENAAEMEVL
jgi:hypothetical protein